jgi:hypothetical protein
MNKKYEKNVNVNTDPVNPEVDEEMAASAATQTEDNKPADPAPEVVEEKVGFFKKAKTKVSKAYNEGITLPPIKTVVKTIGIAAAGAAAAVLVIAKVRDGGEDDVYALEDHSPEEIPEVLEATFEADVPEAEE